MLLKKKNYLLTGKEKSGFIVKNEKEVDAYLFKNAISIIRTGKTN